MIILDAIIGSLFVFGSLVAGAWVAAPIVREKIPELDPPEVRHLKKSHKQIEKEIEKQKQIEHWAQKVQRAEGRLQDMSGDDDRSIDPRPTLRRTGGPYPSPALDAIRAYGETAEEMGKRHARAMENLRKEREDQRRAVMDAYFDSAIARLKESAYKRAETDAERRRKQAEKDRIHQLALRTWHGGFGDGKERMRRLGDDYDAVQAEVNQLSHKPDPPQFHVRFPPPDEIRRRVEESKRRTQALKDRRP